MLGERKVMVELLAAPEAAVLLQEGGHLGGDQHVPGELQEVGRLASWRRGEVVRRPIWDLVGRQRSEGGGHDRLQIGFYDLARTPSMLGVRIVMDSRQRQDAGGVVAAGVGEAGGDARAGGAQGIQRGAGRLVRPPPAETWLSNRRLPVCGTPWSSQCQ